MPDVTFHLETNAELTRQGLEDLAADLPKIGRLSLYRTAQGIYKRAGFYPGELPGQTYKRTRTLYQSRRIDRTDKGYVISINPVDKRGRSYGSYVLGLPQGGGQAAYHQGRWIPIAIITEEELQKLPPEVIKSLREAAAKAAARTHVK